MAPSRGRPWVRVELCVGILRSPACLGLAARRWGGQSIAGACAGDLSRNSASTESLGGPRGRPADWPGRTIANGPDAGEGERNTLVRTYRIALTEGG